MYRYTSLVSALGNRTYNKLQQYATCTCRYMYIVLRLTHIVNPRRACAARFTTVVVCVCLLSHISPLERLFVLKILSRTQQATEVEKCVDFSETAPLQRYTASCVVEYCSDIPRTFSTADPSKGPKKANNRLNSTWNTTRYKVASFFLFSLRLLPKVFRILPVNVVIDLARAFKDSRTRVRRGFCTLVHSLPRLLLV